MESKLKVLIACECSGVVRQAFRKLGHLAYSCDINDSEDQSDYHIKSDVLNILEGFCFEELNQFYPWEDGIQRSRIPWDLLIAHPPCTDLAVSGARYFKEKQADGRQDKALEFVKKLMQAPIKYKCIENPKSIISSKIRKPNQSIQPWMFGHPEKKMTCLWTENLPLLLPTNIVPEHLRSARLSNLSPSKSRARERSRTFQGIADAMAEQWSEHILKEFASKA